MLSKGTPCISDPAQSNQAPPYGFGAGRFLTALFDIPAKPGDHDDSLVQGRGRGDVLHGR